MLTKKKTTGAAAVWIALLGVTATRAADPIANVDKHSARSEILLSGEDWKLGSFPMNEGQRQNAFAPGFAERGFRSVAVPAEIQLTLGLQGGDLYRQSKTLSTINEKEWWYRKSFVVPRAYAGKRIRLVLEGADYFTSVWLNGEKLGDHEGCYTGFSFDVTPHVKLGAENLLAVKVSCPWLPRDRALVEYMKGSFNLILVPGWKYVHSKQLPYALSFGWTGIPSAGNAIMTIGLIRDVKLEITAPQSVEDLYVYTKSLNADGSATLGIWGSARNEGKEAVRCVLDSEVRPANFAGEPLPLPTKDLLLHPGANEFRFEATVKEPKLWWSWDTGPQNLYRLTATLSVPSTRGLDRREVRFGIRTIARGKDLGYRLNGKRLFLKCMWYPSCDYYSSRTTRASYETDLRLLRNANSNAIVNHTVVEKRAFYELCDELGMLVEVQMPFSQMGPLEVLDPGNPRREAFLKMAFDQVGQILRQNRNHPSIITWAPLAETVMYEPIDRGIGRLVADLAPGATYHYAYCGRGEEHLWVASPGLLSGDYRDFFEHRPKFVSEYGAAAMCCYENLHNSLSQAEIWSDENPRDPRWFNMPIDIHAYASLFPSEYQVSPDLDSSVLWWACRVVDRDIRSAKELVDASQLYQAFKAGYASEAYRRAKYHPVQGARWWAFKDPAPGHRFALFDFEQTPRMGYYFYKRAMAPLAVSFALRDALEPHPAGKPLGTAPLSHCLFARTSTPLPVRAGETLVAYAYLDPQSPPEEIMLQWNASDSDWEHRAYWGSDKFAAGTDGQVDADHVHMGPLPALGRWVRLEVPASRVGMEGCDANGLSFTVFGGSAAFDHAGKAAAGSHDPAADTVWVEDALPAGAVAEGPGNYRWFDAGNPNIKPFSGARALLVEGVKTTALPVWVVNDHPFALPLDVTCEVLDLDGRQVWKRTFNTTIGPDESKAVGDVDWKVPEIDAVKVYALRATAEQRGGELRATTTTYVKAVPKPGAEVAKSVAKLPRKCRVLLIGLKSYAQTVAMHLGALGAEVDVIDEDHLDRFAQLKESQALRNKYDVVWLAPFEALWKVLDDRMAAGLAQAVRQGVGLIHTGGEASFHGGNGLGARLDFTRLADVLPVEVRRGRGDLNVLNSSKDVRTVAYGWTDAGLRETGIENFNETQAKADSRVLMKFGSWPLLAVGRYGQGFTVAFMGFTPNDRKLSPMWLGLFAQMLLEAQGENPQYRYATAVAQDKPLMQLLKEQPTAKVSLAQKSVEATIRTGAGRFSLGLSNGNQFARLVRMRTQWNDAATKPHVELYSDNYFDLLPGESKTINVDLLTPQSVAGALEGTLIIEGTNLPEQRVPLRLLESR